MSRTLPRTTSSDHEVTAIAVEAMIRRVDFVAWLDRHDSEAGGSELHAHMSASYWAASGIDVPHVGRTRPAHQHSQRVRGDLNRMLSPGGACTPFGGGVDVRTSDGIHISLAGGDLLRSEVLPTVARIGMEDEAAVRSAG